MRIDTHKHSDPDFGSAEEWIYMHSDSVAGTGTHRGHSVTNYENGDKSYQKWEGTHKTTVKDGAWETKFEGKSQFTGGTGKFKNIKGGGAYKGTMTAKGVTGSGEFEAEY